MELLEETFDISHAVIISYVYYVVFKWDFSQSKVGFFGDSFLFNKSVVKPKSQKDTFYPQITE